MKSRGANASKNRPRGNILLCSNQSFKSRSPSEWCFPGKDQVSQSTRGVEEAKPERQPLTRLCGFCCWAAGWLAGYYLNPKQHYVVHLGQPKCKSKSRVTGHTKTTHCSSPRNLIIQCGSGLGHQLFHLSQSFFFGLLPPTEEV